MNALDDLKADTHRQAGQYAFLLLLKRFVVSRTFRVTVTLRLCQWAASGPGLRRRFLLIFQVLHRIAAHNACMDLPWRTKIGGGVLLVHGWGLVVNEGAVIGSNVTLLHGVTLGQSDRILSDGNRLTQFPIIEDEVWVGPHAIIIGGVTIGKGSRIAGGAFVYESVPPHSLVSGNPASIIRCSVLADVLNPAPSSSIRANRR